MLRLHETACYFSYGYVRQMAVVDSKSIAYFYEAVEKYSRYAQYCSCYLYTKIG